MAPGTCTQAACHVRLWRPSRDVTLRTVSAPAATIKRARVWGAESIATVNNAERIESRTDGSNCSSIGNERREDDE